jgi:Tol biopolymer transport system component/imidazolonepropionase-like amidohydrolase
MKNGAQFRIRGSHRDVCWFLPMCLVLLPACAAPADTPAPAATTEEISIRVSEGTSLMFDIAGDSLVFDLLGQLWLLPASGGNARAITNAVQDTAEDLDPSLSPDGRRVVFRAERGGRTGLWLLDLNTNRTRQLTQVTKADAYDGGAAWSPDGDFVAFARDLPPDSDRPPKSGIELLNMTSGVVRELRVDGLPRPGVRDPAWSPDGRRIAFVNTFARAPAGSRIWMVDATGGAATPVSAEGVQAIAPAFSPDGRRIAFLAPDAANRMQVWVLDASATAPAKPRRLTNHDDVVGGRVRWTRDGLSIVYAADGHLRRIAPAGGDWSDIPFSAHLTFTRRRPELPAARFAEPGEQQPARAFLGLSLSPDAKRIAAIALGKLWIIPVGGTARAVADIPFSARGVAWSPSGEEVAWSGGAWEQEDIFATRVSTGATRRVTALPGRDASPSYSPDGRYLAFVHVQEHGTLRVIDAHATAPVSDGAQTRNLGAASVSWMRALDAAPQWSPASDALLLVGDFKEGKPTTATLVRLSGARRTITRFPDAPTFLFWTQNNAVSWLRHDRLWQAPFDGAGMRAEPQPLGRDPALYASAANDGSVLYISEGGLCLRSPNGAEQRLGWPVSFTAPVPPALLISNVRVIDGTGAPATAPKDVLVERGRIASITAPGTAAPAAAVIDGTGRYLVPGLMDLHAHVYRPDLLPGFVYFGITTVRDQGSLIGPLVAHGDAIAADLLPGPRVSYGGFQFYSDWPFDEEQGRGIEREADPDHVKRSVALATALGAQHIKTRTFRRWDINARMIEEGHRRGMRATGHCAHLLPLVAAGIDAKEHIGLCATRASGSVYSRNDMLVYDDIVQLFRAARIGVVPTISYLSRAAPERNERTARQARMTTGKLARAGITIGTGTDIWQIPTGVHMELEELVASGMSPGEAIRAATSSSAHILGVDKDLGTIEAGKRADLVLLDADPLADIRNTRRIASVIKGGRLVDRKSIVVRSEKLY